MNNLEKYLVEAKNAFSDPEIIVESVIQNELVKASNLRAPSY